MKISVKNFQSIQEAEINAVGLTVITGRSNIGKSALVRAIRGAIFGMPGEFYIRDGASRCEVKLDFGDNSTIQWGKTATGKAGVLPTYLVINGVTMTKMGREHALLTEPLGFKEVETSQERFTPQIAKQIDQPFMLTVSDTVIAEVLKVLGRGDVVTEAQRLAKFDQKNAQDLSKVRELDKQKVETELLQGQAVAQARGAWIKAKTVHDVKMEQCLKVAKLRSSAGILAFSLKPRSIPNVPVVDQKGMELLLKTKRFISLAPVTVPTVPLTTGYGKGLSLLKRAREYRLTENLLEKFRFELLEINRSLATSAERKQKLEKILGTCPTCKRSFQ